jgi:mono/diheme cytochrome c family protein
LTSGPVGATALGQDTPIPPAIEASEAALAGVFALDPVAHGAWLYHAHCYRCHNDYATARLGEQNAPERVLELMTVGTADMVAVSQAAGGVLTDGEIDALAAYIARWEALGSDPALPSAVADAIAATWPERLDPTLLPIGLVGDLARGEALFAQHCVVCHGSEGEGGIGATLTKEWVVDWPDQTVRTTIAHGVPRSAMIAWSQARGGPLSHQEIEDLTLFVLSLSPQAQIPGFLPGSAIAVADPAAIDAGNAVTSGGNVTAAQALSPTTSTPLPTSSPTAGNPADSTGQGSSALLIVGLVLGIGATLSLLAWFAMRGMKRA